MKRITVACISSLFCLQAVAQFPLYMIMPSRVSGIALGDTLLNTRSILQREDIKKIIAVETSSVGRKGASFTTTCWVNNGRIEARSWCYRPSPDTAFRFCMPDTLLYNSKGQLQEYRAMSVSRVAYLKVILEYRGSEMQNTCISYDPKKTIPDTSTYHCFYNGKGQLIRRLDDSNTSSFNVELYYNNEGVLDSIRHENPAWGTIVFNRRKKGKKKEITADSRTTVYRWIFNENGQCLSSYWSFKKPVTSSVQSFVPLFNEVNYLYNVDGTLAKVIEKTNKDKVTIVYSYER